MGGRFISLEKKPGYPNPRRDARINREIFQGVCREKNIGFSWYIYMEDMLHFPFTAMIKAPPLFPEPTRQEARITGLADMDHWGLRQIWLHGALDAPCWPIYIPGTDITDIQADGTTIQAFRDWHYWLMSCLNEDFATTLR